MESKSGNLEKLVMEKTWQLRHSNLFESLSEDELKSLATLVPFRHYPSGWIIYGPGDRTDAFYIIVEGQVVISMLSVEGKEKVLEILQCGDIFGELFLEESARGQQEARALTNVGLYVMDRRVCLDICLRKPQVALSMMAALMRRCHELQEEVADLAFAPARERFLKLLHRFCDVLQLQESVGGICYVRYCQHELATMLGVTRECVNIIIQEFREQGVVETHRGYLTADREKLRRFLEEQENI